MTATRTARGAHLKRWMLNSKPPPTYVKAVGFTGNVDRWQDFEYILPGSVLQWSGAIEPGRGAKENRDQDGFHLRTYHGLTPRTENSCYYFWTVSNGYNQNDPQATQILYDEVYPTFLEDIAILEGQQARVALEPGRQLVGIKADVALTHARDRKSTRLNSSH